MPWIFLLLFFPLFSWSDSLSKSNEEISKNSKSIERLYHLEPGVEIKDITSLVLAHPFTSDTIKDEIKAAKRKIYLFEYPSDHLKVKGFISLTPYSATEPLLVLFRSGNRKFGLLNPGDEWTTYKHYTVISSTLRGGVSEGKDEFGGADVRDMKHLLDYLPVLESKLGVRISTSPLYFLGPSRGGMEMFLTLARYPEIQKKVTKAVSLSGLLDIHQQIANRQDMKNMFIKDFGLEMGANQNEWVGARNPVDKVSELDPCLPLLIIQATNDERVGLHEGYEMVSRLQDAGHLVDYWEVEGTHTLQNRPHFMQTIAEWLESPAKAC